AASTARMGSTRCALRRTGLSPSRLTAMSVGRRLRDGATARHRAAGRLRVSGGLPYAQRLTHARGELEEALRLARLGVAGVGQVHFDDLADAAGPRRHDHDVRAEEH